MSIYSPKTPWFDELAKKPCLLYGGTMTAIQQIVEIDPSRRILRLEKPLRRNLVGRFARSARFGTG
jgi:hypothetical protein